MPLRLLKFALVLIAGLYAASVAISYAVGKPDWSMQGVLRRQYMDVCTQGHAERDAKCARGDASE